MNMGQMIFKRMQRLQGGTGEVIREQPMYDPAQQKWWWEKANEQTSGAGLTPQEARNLTPEEQVQEEIDWQKNIKEILTYTPNLTPEERKQVTDLNPKDWDDSTREKVGQASEQAGRATQLQQGTSNVSPYELAGAWGTNFLPTEPSDWRRSGVAKGPGFLGPLAHKGGQTSTELSIGVGTDKGEAEIPSLVPTLTKDEIDHLLAGGRPTKSIVDKAIAHARLRENAGRDPFYEYGESPSPLRYAQGTSNVGLRLFYQKQKLRKKKL